MAEKIDPRQVVTFEELLRAMMHARHDCGLYKTRHYGMPEEKRYAGKISAAEARYKSLGTGL